MKFNVKLLELQSSITQKILTALKDDVSKTINAAIPKINDDIKELVADALRQEPEYSSLLSGTLKAEFGIQDASSVERIVQALVSTIKIEQKPISITNNGLKGGFSLTMMKSDDMDGIIYIDSASVVDNQKGYVLPWLEWLLYRNNQPIVRNYAVDYTNSPYSRSGLAIMVPDSSNWRVPPEFAGSTRNNWTTRAISRLDPSIYNTIITNIRGIL
jgi:hypothetical protein